MHDTGALRGLLDGRWQGLDRLLDLTHHVVVNRSRLFEEALALPEDDRLKLAAELLASSPPPGILHAGSPDLAKVVQERIDSVRSGKTKPIPAPEALARLRRPRTER